jgi:hypothetical protein
MKQSVLFTFLLLFAIGGYAQTTFRTAQSGNYSSSTTWQGGLAGTPVLSGSCNCKIVIEAGHTLTLDQNVSLNNAAIILDGANSKLTFLSNVDLTLTGINSSIDIQSGQASITRANPNNQIFLEGQEIYNGGSTKFQSTVTGTVQGPASAAASRANVQFQNGTLPVKLAEFKISSNSTEVTLTWKTSTEINSSHFEIERSSDGKIWSTQGTVQAAGNVSVDHNYSFSDESPNSGTNHYRLKIVDIDGKFEYSLIKSVNFTSTALNVVAGPNPANSFLNISVNAPGNEPYRLRLINRSGQVMFDQKYAASSKRMQLSVSNYADGTYFLEVTNNSGVRQVSKVLIVRK